MAYLPHTVGLLVMGLGASLLIIGAEAALPGLQQYEELAGLVRQIDFQETVLDGMLAFLLFADALHVDAPSLRSRAWLRTAMATIFATRAAALTKAIRVVAEWTDFADSELHVTKRSATWRSHFPSHASPHSGDA